MDSRAVQWIVPIVNAQKSRRLLEGLRPQAGDRQQIPAGAEWSVLISVSHHCLCQLRPQAGDPGQKLNARGIDIHAHLIHAGRNHIV